MSSLSRPTRRPGRYSVLQFLMSFVKSLCCSASGLRRTLMDYRMAARPVLDIIDAGNDPVRDADCGLNGWPENGSPLHRV